MSESKRMNSIARRISTSFALRLLFILLLVNGLIAASILGFTIYNVEKAALGSAWQADLVRDIQVDESLPRSLRIKGVVYQFGLPGGEIHSIPAGDTLTTLVHAQMLLLAAEVLIVVGQYQGFRRRSLYLLSPLTQMAKTAQALSETRFDEQKFHSLEDAIENLSVHSPGARLATGHSELVGLENAVNNLISRMHDAYHQQTRFVSDASHELRTPIAVIRGYADLLARWGKDDRKVMEEAVEAIQGEADNMQRLVEQLLFLARGDAGRVPFTPTRVDLALLAREVHEEYTLIDKQHAWRLRADEPVWARGDEAMLKQALRILADNAIKFSPQGAPITLRAFQNAQGQACLSVQDNGSGISPEHLPHIFERFYREDPSRGRGGTGLGLSIAQYITQRHQGHVEVTSVEGLGTRFTLSLPPAGAETEAAEPQAASQAEG